MLTFFKKDGIALAGDNETQVAFKNCARLIKHIIKNDGTAIVTAEDLDLAIPMYNLLEYFVRI